MKSEIKQRITQLNNGEIPNGYEKTEFGVFPTDWVKDKKLKDIGTFGKGKGIPGDKMTSDGVPCVGYGDIYMKYNNFHFENAQSFVDEQTASESQPIEKGTLLFTGTGETADEIGKCVCYNGNETIYAGGDIITFVSDNVNPLFLSYQQYQPFSLKKKASFGQGHSVVHIRRENLEKLNVAYPESDAEQSKIAEILMKWEEAIELRKNMIEKLKTLRKAYFNNLFPCKDSTIPEFRFFGFDDPWEERAYSDIGENFQGGNLSYDDLAENGKYKAVLYGDLYTRYDGVIKCIKRRTNRKGLTVQKNDILFPQSTTVDAYSLIAPACLNEESAETSGVFVIRPNENINGNFISYYTKGNKDLRKRLARKTQGFTIIHLYYQSIKNEKILIPSLKEQNKIADMFLQLDNFIDLHVCELEKIKAQRNALQQYLLNGIVRV